jgi:peptide/nickel transport system permease protein
MSASVLSNPAVGAEAGSGRLSRRGRDRSPLAWVRSPKAIAGLSIVGFFVLMAILGPILSPYDPSQTSTAILQAPSSAHWLGTTALGEDVLSQVLTGARLSLEVGISAAIVSEFIAVLVGVTAGYLGGVGDEVLSLLTNVILVIPVLPLQIVIVSFLGGGSWLLLAAVIAFTTWSHGARKLRAQTLSIRRRDYVEAARAAGEPTLRIVIREILPNLWAIVVTNFLFSVMAAIVVQSGLAFLGLGDIDQWSWGSILYWSDKSNAFLLGDVWWFAPPGLCIALLAAGFGLINLGVDEVINPRLRAVFPGSRRSRRQRRDEVLTRSGGVAHDAVPAKGTKR